VGVYNAWIDKSIERLAQMMPARYARSEESPGFIDRIGPYRYAQVSKPSSPVVPARTDGQSAQTGQLSGTERPEQGEPGAASPH
jgi:hypothetical protein